MPTIATPWDSQKKNRKKFSIGVKYDYPSRMKTCSPFSFGNLLKFNSKSYNDLLLCYLNFWTSNNFPSAYLITPDQIWGACQSYLRSFILKRAKQYVPFFPETFCNLWKQTVSSSLICVSTCLGFSRALFLWFFYNVSYDEKTLL